MRLLIQRVSHAKVTVAEKSYTSSISKGLLVFVGFSKEDSEDKLDYAVSKILNLRLWASDEKGLDKSLKDINGEVMVVSQFTLYGIVEGNKPNFKAAGEYDNAEILYNKLIERLKKEVKVGSGVFGAKMKVELENDGPVTIMLEK